MDSVPRKTNHLLVKCCIFLGLVAEVTQPSLGVGYEIGRAIHLNKSVLCLFRPDSGKSEYMNRIIFYDLNPI